MSLLSKKEIEKIIKDKLGIIVNLQPVDGRIFGNVADYQVPLPLWRLSDCKIYARTHFDEVDIYLTFDNKIHSDNYDGGFYACDGKHYVVLLEGAKREDTE